MGWQRLGLHELWDTVSLLTDTSRFIELAFNFEDCITIFRNISRGPVRAIPGENTSPAAYPVKSSRR